MDAETAVAGRPGSRSGNLVNFVGFQVVWLAVVTSAAGGRWWLGAALGLAWLAYHLACESRAPRADARVMVLALVLGAFTDTFLVLGGQLAFTDVSRVGALTAPWMLVLWLAFAATLRHSLGWMRGRYRLAIVLGAVAGPLAYRGGEALGAIVLPGGFESLGYVSLQYAVVTPVLLMAASRGPQPRGNGAGTVGSGQVSEAR